MPSVNYYQNTAPFWDFIANMEQQAQTHPLFAGNQNNRAEGEEEATNTNEQSHPWGSGNPWEGGFPFAFGGPFAHRGRHAWGHGPPRHHGHGHPPPPPPGHEDGPTPPEKEHDPEEGPSEPRGPPPPFSEKPDHPAGPHHRGGKHCGGGARGRGGWGGRGGHFGRRGGRGGNPWAQMAEMFQSQLFGADGETKEKEDDSFKPDVDVFDTTDSFVIHISLPGAKKEDVGVNWDAEHSELSIGGVVYRPGDEELLKTLALDERKVGAFDRKVRLGSRANPAQIDVDGITAKMEDGVLRVDVPKLDGGYVEIKKVDIE